MGINVIFSVALDLYMPFLSGCRAIPGPWLWPSFSWLRRPGFRALSGSGLAGSHGSRRRHRKSYGSGREDPHGYSQSRLRFDMVTMAFLLSLFFGGDKTLVVLGVGTIVSAMTVGRLVNFFNRRLFFIERLARLSLEDQNESPVLGERSFVRHDGSYARRSHFYNVKKEARHHEDGTSPFLIWRIFVIHALFLTTLFEGRFLGQSVRSPWLRCAASTSDCECASGGFQRLIYQVFTRDFDGTQGRLRIFG